MRAQRDALSLSVKRRVDILLKNEVVIMFYNNSTMLTTRDQNHVSIMFLRLSCHYQKRSVLRVLLIQPCRDDVADAFLFNHVTA